MSRRPRRRPRVPDGFSWPTLDGAEDTTSSAEVAGSLGPRDALQSDTRAIAGAGKGDSDPSSSVPTTTIPLLREDASTAEPPTRESQEQSARASAPRARRRVALVAGSVAVVFAGGVGLAHALGAFPQPDDASVPVPSASSSVLVESPSVVRSVRPLTTPSASESLTPSPEETTEEAVPAPPVVEDAIGSTTNDGTGGAYRGYTQDDSQWYGGNTGQGDSDSHEAEESGANDGSATDENQDDPSPKTDPSVPETDPPAPVTPPDPSPGPGDGGVPSETPTGL